MMEFIFESLSKLGLRPLLLAVQSNRWSATSWLQGTQGSLNDGSPKVRALKVRHNNKCTGRSSQTILSNSQTNRQPVKCH
mmetsp:Transcript_22132/g.48393  ORF Transcript_22132/g.48393 Transcript_22132/m.48393 type:complete len:80 (-) Transcript_22132:101-340(-)